MSTIYDVFLGFSFPLISEKNNNNSNNNRKKNLFKVYTDTHIQEKKFEEKKTER